MKATSKSGGNESSIQRRIQNRRRNISIPLNELINAVSKLGENIIDIDNDGRWRSETSLWAQVVNKLNRALSIKNTLGVRKYIYAFWHRKSSKLRSYFVNDPLDTEHSSNLQELSSLPSYTEVCTRSSSDKSSRKTSEAEKPQQHLIEFSYDEWRKIYKKDPKNVNMHYMDPSWTEVFYEKLVARNLVTCSLIFKKSRLRKKYTRKQNTPLFRCFAKCQYPGCTLAVSIVAMKTVSSNNNVIFRVQITGTPRHEDASIVVARPLKGAKRLDIANLASKDGILQTYENNIINADPNLLRSNNFTQVPTMDVLKTAVKEQAKTMHLHQDMFVELDLMMRTMMHSDNDSKTETKGYIQTLQMWPFATIFYTEAQLVRFIEYCLSTKDSYVYVDATGSVVRALSDQRKPYFYLACFKDGKDPSDLLPLAGALLTDHTAASISNWLMIVRRGIASIKSRFIRPTYIAIDFSPALLNAILSAVNNTNINSYLRWCFNAIQNKYTSDQLRSMTCIRFCCAHVMHAFTRSLSKIKLNKCIRRKATMAFGILLNCNEFDQTYDLICCIINIFGLRTLDNPEQCLDDIIKACGDFNADFQTFFEDADISSTERAIQEELAELDDNFLSSEPIIHQSPFSQLARERSPVLSAILSETTKNEPKNTKNLLFSKELIKLFYKWVAYLPIFTGIMHQFDQRYASDLLHTVKPKIFGHGRVSNATIESFFKILKHSILRHQTNMRPAEFLLKLYSTTNARIKANEYNIKQSGSRKRNRSAKQQIDAMIATEKWKAKGSRTPSRGAYFTNVKEITLTENDIRIRLREKLEIRKQRSSDCPEDDGIALAPSVDSSPEKCNDRSDTCKTPETSEAVRSQKANLLPAVNVSQMQEVSPISSPVSDPLNISESNAVKSPVKSLSATPEKKNDTNDNIEDKSKTLQCKDNSKREIIEFYLPPIGWPTHTMIGNLRLPFPHFNIKPTFFNGNRYSASNTCSLDSSLFLLYYIYISNSEEFRSLFDPNVLVSHDLRTTFELVGSQGWDIARLNWITRYSTSVDKSRCAQHLDLYGTADTNVFQYVRELQKYGIRSTCKSKDCPKSVKLSHSVDISMPQTVGRNRRVISLKSFSEQYNTNCGATIGSIQPTSYDGMYSRDNFFPAKDGNGTRTMFICESGRIVEPHKFVNRMPPIILLNVGQIMLEAKHNTAAGVSVKCLPSVVMIGKQRFYLAGAICTKPDHFTATIVRSKGKFCRYDDRCKFGVVDNVGGDDFVETAIYAIELDEEYMI